MNDQPDHELFSDPRQAPSNLHEPTDAHLDALLDEVLAPQDWPDASHQRAYAAMLAASAAATTGIDNARANRHDDPSPVIARIGSSLAWAVAAAVALGTAIIAITLSAPDTVTPNGPIAQQTPSNATAPNPFEDELQTWSTYARAAAQQQAWNDAAWVDDELQLIQTQIALTSSEELWGHDDPWESLEVADLHRELDAMAYPLTPAF